MTSQADLVPTSDGPAPPSAQRTSPIDELVAAMQELDKLHTEANEPDPDLATRLNGLINRIAESVNSYENRSPASEVLVQQAREARAVALDTAAVLLPAEFAGRPDAYSQLTFGRAWDRNAVEKQTINRLVNGYLVAAEVPADVTHVLALHAATFPRNSMNVQLYATISERLGGSGNVSAGAELARAGLLHCAGHPDVSRLQDRMKRIYRENPGEIGVPMNFAGPTLRESRFMLSSLQGRPVLVVFWSTTNSISEKFLAKCLILGERYSMTEIEVVGVSLDANLQYVESWRAEHTAPCRLLFSAEQGHAGLDNPIARFYRVTALPAFFLLDRDGVVITRGANKIWVVENELRRLSTPRLAFSDRKTN